MPHDCACAGLTNDVRASFTRVSHDVRANFRFIFSQLSLKMVLFMSQSIRICIAYLSQVQIAETKLRCVCERLRRVGNGFATHAMTLRLFCDDFCRTKKYSMFKTFANCSRPFATHRDACEEFAMPCERLATGSRIDSQNSRELVAS